MTALLSTVSQSSAGADQNAAPCLSDTPPYRTLVNARMDTYFLGERLFKDAVVRERRRADRQAAPFAVLVVDRVDRSFDESAWVPIVRAVSAVKGDAEVAGWLEKDAALGLLLPEASAKRALKAKWRLRREIATRLGVGALGALSTRLYAHGLESAASGAAFPPVDMLIDAFVLPPHHPVRDAAKRGLDVVGSVVLLATFAPVWLAVFAVVKCTSPGPAIYRQVRVGRRGEPFTMLKFRTMHVNAGHGIHKDYMDWFISSSGQQPRNGDEVFKLTNDPRITPLGRALRHISMDEVPQFLNVLRGEMSLVGPRPPLPSEVERYQPWHRRRVLEAKPGITGLWQVKGRSRTTFDEMVRMDLEYARTHSLWTDLKLLAATPIAMFKGGV